MKGDVYYGKGIRELEDQYPELYELVSDLNETVTLNYMNWFLI